MSSYRASLILRLLDGLEAVRAALWPTGAARAVPYVFLAPAVLLVFLLALGMLYVGDSSLRVLDRSTFQQSETYSLGNYALIAERTVYLRILWRSLLAAVVVSLVTLALGVPYAYVMVRTASSALRKLLLIGLFLPFLIGQVVRAYGWLIVLGHQGLINSGLGVLGLGPLKLIYTYPTVVVGLIQYMLPFAVLMLAPAITAIPEDVESASDGLGARWWQTLWYVVLPMAKPGLVAASVVVFTITLTDFAMPEILGGGGNDFIANAIHDGFFAVSDAGLGSALAVLLVLIGSTCVTVLFALLGTGTLGLKQRGTA